MGLLLCDPYLGALGAPFPSGDEGARGVWGRTCRFLSLFRENLCRPACYLNSFCSLVPYRGGEKLETR
jgi:hypothetical protein